MIAGSVEEPLKAGLAIALFLFARSGLRTLPQAVVIAYLSGAAFGTVELCTQFAGRLHSGEPLDLGTGYQEVLLLQPGITAITGLGVGLALSVRPRALRALLVIGGLAVAIGMHTVWDISGGGFTTPPGLRLAYFLVFYSWLVTLAVIMVRSRRANPVAPSLERSSESY